MSQRFLSLPIDEVSLRQIRPSLSPLRDDLGDIAELCESIRSVGLIQPIIIRSAGGSFEVVAGNRRFEACRRLRWRTIPCHIVELSDKEAYEIALSENIHRKTMDPLEEARALRRYVEEAGWGGITELSARIRKSQAYISKRIRLLDLPPEVLEKIFRRRKSASIGEEILTLETSEQLEVARILEETSLPVSQVRSLVGAIKEARERTTKSARAYDAPPWEGTPERSKLVAGCIDQTIAALRLALSRLDNAISKIEEEWVEKEALTQYRLLLHREIDSLLRLKKKFGARSGRYR